MMMRNHEKRTLYWEYFLALEADIESLSRYIEIAPANFATYSTQLTHLFLASSSEINVVAKALCTHANEESQARNIGQYKDELRAKFPEIETTIITLPRFGLERRPWAAWEENAQPQWWDDHNDVKHDRGAHYEKANLANVLDSMSALFGLLLIYYRDVTDKRGLSPPPAVFAPPMDIARVRTTLGGGVSLSFVS